MALPTADKAAGSPNHPQDHNAIVQYIQSLETTLVAADAAEVTARNAAIAAAVGSGGGGGSGAYVSKGTFGFNIMDYGAVADPAVDNRTAILAAISASTAAGGGYVYAPAGVFGFTGELDFTNGFVGAGVNVVGSSTRGTTLKALSNTASIRVGSITNGATAIDNRGGRIGHFTIDGSDLSNGDTLLKIGLVGGRVFERIRVEHHLGAPGVYAAMIFGAQNCVFEKLSVVNSQTGGLVLTYGAGGNLFFMCNTSKATTGGSGSALKMTQVYNGNTYTTGPYSGQGPSQNFFLNCIFERVADSGQALADFQCNYNNVFAGTIFAAGSQTSTYVDGLLGFSADAVGGPNLMVFDNCHITGSPSLTTAVTGAATGVGPIHFTGRTIFKNHSVGFNWAGNSDVSLQAVKWTNVTTHYNVTGSANFEFVPEAGTRVERPLGTDIAHRVRVDTDSGDRWRAQADGTLLWGDGTGTGIDTKLYRGGSDTLQTDDQFRAQRTSTGSYSFAAKAVADTFDRWRVKANGNHEYGSGSVDPATDLIVGRTGAGQWGAITGRLASGAGPIQQDQWSSLTGYGGINGYHTIVAPDGTTQHRVFTRSSTATPLPATLTPAIKASDTVRISNNTRTADPDLAVTVVSGGVYQVNLFLIYDGSTTGKMSLGWNTPGASTGYWSPNSLVNTTSSDTGTIVRLVGDWSTSRALGCAGVGTLVMANPMGILTAGASGTVAVTWAQNTVDATNLTVRTGSYLQLTRIA